MTARRCLLIGMMMWPLAAVAGHGLLNSFNDLEWLPPAGRTPDQWTYALDTGRERLALWRAQDGAAALALCEQFMRDKLADLEAMVNRGNAEAAARALQHYDDYRERAERLVEDSPPLRERLALRLLEHQYMLSVDYPDLPADARDVVAALIDDLARHYAKLRKRLPRATAESLFFKEEEVRWSWEMGRRATALP